MIQLPQLLSNLQIAHNYVRAYGPYRAEDCSYTAPPGDFVIANIATVLTHTRAAQGLRAPNPAGNFWSEAIGDTFGDEAHARLQKDPQTGCYLLPKQDNRFQIAPARAHALFEQVEDLITLCQECRKVLEQPANEEALQHLMQIEGGLTEPVSEGFETLYQSLNQEIAEQLEFAGRFFATYPDLMTACDALVKAGKMPIRRFLGKNQPRALGRPSS